MIKPADLEAAALLAFIVALLCACEARTCPEPGSVCTWPMSETEDMPAERRECES